VLPTAMSREAIEVGAFTWNRIQRLYEPDATEHWQRCDVERLKGTLKGGPEQMRGVRRMRRTGVHGLCAPGLRAAGLRSAMRRLAE
jgi:hypothetical protein